MVKYILIISLLIQILRGICGLTASKLAHGCDKFNNIRNIKRRRKKCIDNELCMITGVSCISKQTCTEVDMSWNYKGENGRLCNINRWCQGTEEYPIKACVPTSECNAPNDSQKYNDDYHKPPGTPTTSYAKIESDVGLKFGKGQRPISSSKLALAGGQVDFVYCKILCNEHPQCGRIMFASTSVICKKEPSRCLTTGDKRPCKLLPFEWTGNLIDYTSPGNYNVYGWNYAELPKKVVPEGWNKPECQKLEGTGKCNMLDKYLWNTWFDKANGTVVTPCFMFRNNKKRCMKERQEHGCTYSEHDKLCGKIVMMYEKNNKLTAILLVNEKEDAHLVTRRKCKLLKDNNYEVTGVKPDYICGKKGKP